MPKGSTYGVIGRNGSGKSTALKLVAGITKPTSGTVRVDGRISALIELGAGFHPEISGRENVFINGIMLGLTKRRFRIASTKSSTSPSCSEFIDAPVKTYSSGMYMRLGFAVAIHVDPDVLLVDEVLAVGDEGFTHKCLDKFAEFKRRSKTILLVTHSLSLVERFCDEAVWLDAGPEARGRRSQAGRRRLPHEGRGRRRTADGGDHRERRRTCRAAGRRPDGLATADRGPRPTCSRRPKGDGDRAKSKSPRSRSSIATGSRRSCSTRAPDVGPAEVRAAQPVDDFVFGIGLFNADGVCCYGTNTYLEEMNPERLTGEAEATFAIDSLDLVEGTYKLDVAVHKRDGFPYDYHRLLYTFRVKSRTHDVGIYRPRHRWTFSPGVRFKAEAMITCRDGCRRAR